MNRIYKNILLLSIGVLSFSSCSDFLDENPDNRTVIDSKDKVQKLLTSAYSADGFAVVAEMSSDNVIDEGDADSNIELLIQELAYWKDVQQEDNDDVNGIWESNYKAIASSNLALEAINKLKGTNSDLMAEKGEALITRAYSYFVLVNVFAKHYNPSSSNTDLGVSYIEEPEKTLNPKYKRNTVEEVYSKINRDIEQALPLLSDDIYTQPRYHFNKLAAYAFAARFNLYYGKWDKAIEYANKVVNKDLIDWAAKNQLSSHKAKGLALMQDSGVLMLQTDISSFGTIFGPYFDSTRINHNETLSNYETSSAGMPWGNLNLGTSFKMRPFVARHPIFKKCIFPKNPYLFEYTDPVAQIGYSRTVYNLFTVDETLLIRAEAKINIQDYDGALEDLNRFKKNYFNDQTDVDLDGVNDFYNGMQYSSSSLPTQKKELHPVNLTILNKDHENMLHFVLQCRRLLTLHEGLRWFDIKRYGIEVNRLQKQVSGSYVTVETLQKDDPRKAIQLPNKVIQAGYTPNPR